MQKIKWKNSAALLLAAFVWGVAFVAQRVGMVYVEPFTFNGIRCLIGSLVLLPCIFFFDRFKTSEEKEVVKSSRKTLWIGGILCGAILFVATNAQQIGIQYTSAGKAGFITALYIVFVPIIGIFLKKKCSFPFPGSGSRPPPFASGRSSRPPFSGRNSGRFWRCTRRNAPDALAGSCSTLLSRYR